MLKDHEEDLKKDAHARQWTECAKHNCLAHYQPARWLCFNEAGVNQNIHNSEVDRYTAQTTARLLCGGQGLRAGDAKIKTKPTMENTCIYCLRRGARKAETLAHFLGTCPLHAHSRKAVGKTVTKRSIREICMFDRGCAKRRMQRFIADAWKRRRAYLKDTKASTWAEQNEVVAAACEAGR